MGFSSSDEEPAGSGSRRNKERSRSRDRNRDRDRDRGNRGRSRDRGGEKKRGRSPSRSRSRDETRDPSPTYSADDLWRRLEHLGQWRGLGKKEKLRSKLAGAEKDDLRSLESKMDKRLARGYRSSCIRTSLSILEHGYEVPKKQLETLLAQSPQRPGVTQVCMSLKLLQIQPNATIGIEAFLRGLGVLVQRNAPVQLIRLWLNLGIPRGARALKSLPYDYDDEEKSLAMQELEDALGVITDDEEDEKGAQRRTIYVTGCKARPELNGRYERNDDISAHRRPVYEKIVEKKIERNKGKGKGKGPSELKKLLMPQMMMEEEDEYKQEVLVIHYRKDANSTRNGWWMSRNSCGGEGLAWNAREIKGPPAGGWFCIRDRAKLPDPIQVVDPSKAGEKQKSRRDEAQRAIEMVNPERIKGRISTHDNSVAAAEYFGHFCMLMHLEHMEELRQIKRRTQRLPEAELMRLGWCLDGLPCTGVFGRRDPKKATLIGWEDPGSEMGALGLPPSTQFDRLKFRRGDSVTISESKQQMRKGMDLEKLGDGFVADLRPTKGREEAQVVIRLRGCWPDDAMGRRWRIDKGANSTLYERQLQAMLNLVQAARPRVSELLITAKVGLADSWAKQWRKGGISEEEAKAAAAAAERASKEEKENPAAKLARLNPGGTESDKLDRALKEVKTLTHLNQSQRDAVKSALRSTCTVIQGPPGTGKTHVSVQIMKMWSKTLDLSPLLATSDSNVAVDNIAMGLIKEGVKAVRVGRPDKINRILEKITLECLLEKEKEELDTRRYQARFRSRSRSNSGSPLRKREKSKSKSRSPSPQGDNGKGKGKGKKKGKGAMKADFDLQMRILQDADVICTTTISSGGDFFSKFAFAGILVDEAAQATELAAVVPLILRGTQRLVLVGDQCQLPPTVQSSEAEERGLSLSLYSRMVDGGGVTPFLLDIQYRSNPIIAEFSARTFYANRLKSGVRAEDRKAPRGLPWPRDGCPIAFVDVHTDETTEGDSKLNCGEAEVVNRIVQDVFYQRELEITEVGVVTPYVAQVRMLKRMLRNIVPEGADPELLEVASVDNFQGREKDLIIFSAVRSNRTGTVGFLADWRRLNVMLTRARRGIVIVGNSRTLKTDQTWAKWLEFYSRVASGRARTPSPEKKKEHIPVNETPEQTEARLKKERVEAARKLSMAIRFPGLAMASQEKKERSRSRSYSPMDTMNDSRKVDIQAKGGRTKPRQRTPSPERASRVVKEVGIGRRTKNNEFASAVGGRTAAKAKPKAKPKLALSSDGEGSAD
eukprot:TRINITY_DN4013_c0_g3_i1.p1 TRINITY_DN4013_c0_g3~~TRINITY_DN4013_c0_g3_i1.p1  ORF type:complete len:1279 (+),score=261.33 TRINITY_DN4013_c0_g3_i1:76-3912(+)